MKLSRKQVATIRKNARKLNLQAYSKTQEGQRAKMKGYLLAVNTLR